MFALYQNKTVIYQIFIINNVIKNNYLMQT